MDNCGQACQYNTLDGCKVEEYRGVCPLTNTAPQITEHKMTNADVAPVRHGRWERVIPSKSAAKWSTKVSCSNCHSAGYTRYKYCPNCGAKMGLEDER